MILTFACKSESAREGVAIMISGLSDSNVLLPVKTVHERRCYGDLLTSEGGK